MSEAVRLPEGTVAHAEAHFVELSLPPQQHDSNTGQQWGSNLGSMHRDKQRDFPDTSAQKPYDKK